MEHRYLVDVLIGVAVVAVSAVFLVYFRKRQPERRVPRMLALVGVGVGVGVATFRFFLGQALHDGGHGQAVNATDLVVGLMSATTSALILVKLRKQEPRRNGLMVAMSLGVVWGIFLALGQFL